MWVYCRSKTVEEWRGWECGRRGGSKYSARMEVGVGVLTICIFFNNLENGNKNILNNMYNGCVVSGTDARQYVF